MSPDQDVARAMRRQEALAGLNTVTPNALRAGTLIGVAARALSAATSEYTSQDDLYWKWRDGDVTDAELADELGAAWTLGGGVLGQREWLSMFRAARKATGAPVTRIGAHGAKFAAPAKPITAWRGSALGRVGREMSWSMDRQVALNYAQQAADLHRQAALYRVSVPPSALLGYFPEVRELVVEPRAVARTRVLERKVEARGSGTPDAPGGPDVPDSDAITQEELAALLKLTRGW